MVRYLVMLSLLCLPLLLQAQQKSGSTARPVDSKLTPGAALLFKNVKTKATVAEKNRIFQELDLKVAKDNMGFTMADYTVETYVYPTDMNGDGQEELFLGFGSAALFGNVGEGFALYIKDKSGSYRKQEEIGRGRPMILSTKNAGYPDMLIGGPGFEYPVYRWNGRTYAYHRKMKDESPIAKAATDIEQYSKSYTGTK